MARNKIKTLNKLGAALKRPSIGNFKVVRKKAPKKAPHREWEGNVAIDLVGTSIETFEQGLIRLALDRLDLPFRTRYLEEVQTIAVSRAPVRIDTGGWSDCWWFLKRYPGFVCNLALALYSSAIAVVWNKRGKVRYHALDIDKKGPLDQLQEEFAYVAAKEFPEAFNGFQTDIIVNAEAPPKAGLGSSGSVGVAIVALLAQLAGKKMSRERIALLAHHIEHDLQGRQTGIQDQVAAAFGHSKIEMHKRKFPRFRWSPVSMPPGMRQLIEAAMILVNTGEGRSSSEEHERKIAIIQRGGKQAQGAFSHINAMAEAARRAASSLEKGDWRGFCLAVGDNWDHQKQLDAEAVTPRIALLTETAEELGAKCKGWGAAGGGVLGILAPRGREQRAQVEAALAPILAQMRRASIITTALATGGVEVCAFTAEEFVRLSGRPRLY